MSSGWSLTIEVDGAWDEFDHTDIITADESSADQADISHADALQHRLQRATTTMVVGRS
jgi:hypothetical protein